MMQDNFDRTSNKPIKIPAPGLKAFLKKNRNVKIVDQVIEQLEELFLLRNPKHRFDKNYADGLAVFLKANKKNVDAGNWFYYPWLQLVVHFLPEKMHFELKTGRNKNLITKDEQEKFYNSCIGVLGMSVGSHVALTIAMIGGAKHIKLADPDTISGSNLNRIRVGFHMVGVSKVVAVARQICEINPYSKIEIFKDGINEKNSEKFLEGARKLDVLVEEMDNPFLKIYVRQIARQKMIPIVMAADNGDGIIADVERFDLDGNYPILHGIVKNLTSEMLKNAKPEELPQIIAQMAGANMAVPRMLESVSEVGKTLYSWPQLGTAATMCGSVLAYLTRKVALREPSIVSGRWAFGPEKVFELTR